jgi:hypothetical protein
MKALFLTLIAALSLSAADATGTWTGNFSATTPEGERQHSAMLVLKQQGTTLTGTAGPDATEQLPISNGKAEGDVLTFEVVRENGPTMKFNLKQTGDEIAGDIKREREGQVQLAKILVKREVAAAR